MGNASNAQTSFLGGEFSPYAQGVFNDPEYPRGMNVCRNTFPIESGAAVRRSGSRLLGYTRRGAEGKLIPFAFTETVPTTMEFTEGYLRFYDNEKLILAEAPRRVKYISQASPAALITTPGDNTWSAGNTVIFNFLLDGASTASGALVDRQFTLAAGADDNHWFLNDAITGQPLDGSTVVWDSTLAIQVGRIFEITTPYNTTELFGLRFVQDEDSVLMLSGARSPYTLFAPIDGGNLYTFNKTQFQDGPYLDPPADGAHLTTSGVTGVITMVLEYPAWSSGTTYRNGTNAFVGTQLRSGSTGAYNVQYAAGTVVTFGGLTYVSLQDTNLNHSPDTSPTYWKVLPSGYVVSPSGFQAGDVGRAIRLFAEPFEWVAATSYTTGQLVKYQDAYYTALQATTGNIPGTDITNWGVASNAALWTWGFITAAADATHFSVSIQGDPLLYNQNVLTWRLGVYADSTAWPTCGAFHEGRFWLGGAVENRFDASGAAGNTYNFSPTAPDGTVSDANAISYVLKSKERNQILWFTPALGGILAGTAQAEWLIQSSVNNDPITPTNIQAHDHTNYGSANVEVTRCGQTVAFVQRFGNMVLEYLADLFSGKPTGKNLSQRAKHLTGAGVVRLAYQQELVPILWALTADNKLIGTTYKRESMMVSQPPNFNGWHRHDLGSGRVPIDMVTSGSPSGLYQTPMLITRDPSGICRVEALTDMFDETSTLSDAWFVDGGILPSSGLVSSTGVTLSGFADLNGDTVTAFLCGLDCGDYTVANGQIFVPYGSDVSKLFTLAYLQSTAGKYTDFSNPFVVKQANVTTSQTIMEFPPISSTVLARYTYLNYGAQALCDWPNDRVTFLLPGTGPEAGLVQYRISTGAFLQYLTNPQIFGSVNPPRYNAALTYAASPIVVGSNGNIYTAVVNNSQGVNPTSTGQTDWAANTNPSTIPAAYNSGTTYASGAFVTSAGSIYRSKVNSNTGHTPASSPTQWQLYYATPAAWNATTVYGSVVYVTGSNDEIYWTLGQTVPAAQGDPTSFSTNQNPFWQTLGAVWPVARISSDGVSLDANGDIWMYQSGTSLGTTYVRIDGAKLTLKGVVGVAPGQSVPSPSNYSVPVRLLNNDGSPQTDYMLETTNAPPAGGSGPTVVMIDVGGLQVAPDGIFELDEGSSPIPCIGRSGIGFAQAYAMTRPLSGNATSASVGLYEITASGFNTQTLTKATHDEVWVDPNFKPKALNNDVAINSRKCGLISPQSIDPLWTFFTGFTGLMFDPSDGNVMTFVGSANPANYNSSTVYAVGTTIINYAVGSDGNVYKALSGGTLPNPVGDMGVHWQLIRAVATQFSYMVKFLADNASVLWALPITGVPSTDIGFQSTAINNGYYDYLESLGLGNWQVRRVHTLTGASEIIYPGQAGFAQLGDVQVFDGLTGNIVIFPQYDDTAMGTSAPPTPVNPAGGTTPSSFTGWARWSRISTAPVGTGAVQSWTVSGVVGYTFDSQGQLLRPVAPQETGARNGPAFGKSRRNQRYAVALANTIGPNGIKFGTRLTGTPNLRAALLATAGATPYLDNQLYTGEHSATIEDTYSYDGMIAWQVSRPVPAVVTALGGFLETNDR